MKALRPRPAFSDVMSSSKPLAPERGGWEGGSRIELLSSRSLSLPLRAFAYHRASVRRRVRLDNFSEMPLR